MSNIKNLLDQICNMDEAAPITLNSILTSKISERIDQFKQDFVNRTFNGVRENIEDYSLEELEEYMMSEEFKQLDEISGKLLGSYIQKARADQDKKWAHGRELDQDEKVKELRNKRWELGNRREYNSRGESKHRKTIDKLSNDIEKRKKKIDPNYPKSTNGHKRYNGIERAVKKLTTGKLTGE